MKGREMLILRKEIKVWLGKVIGQVVAVVSHVSRRLFAAAVGQAVLV